LEFRTQTKATAFADDLLLAVKAESIREEETITNIDMNKILTWAKNNKLAFKEEKSKTMIITRRKIKENKEKTAYTYMNNKIIEQVQKIKYLRIIIDSKLTFREYIIHISSKCTKIIHALSKSAKQNWGLSHAALHTIYKGAVLPIMLHGALVWAKALKKELTKQFTTECSA
jgi:hypothetical protein